MGIWHGLEHLSHDTLSELHGSTYLPKLPYCFLLKYLLTIYRTRPNWLAIYCSWLCQVNFNSVLLVKSTAWYCQYCHLIYQLIMFFIIYYYLQLIHDFTPSNISNKHLTQSWRTKKPPTIRLNPPTFIRFRTWIVNFGFHPSTSSVYGLSSPYFFVSWAIYMLCFISNSSNTLPRNV